MNFEAFRREVEAQEGSVNAMGSETVRTERTGAVQPNRRN